MRQRVLIVKEDPEERRRVRQLLVGESVDVDVAGDGGAALAILEHRPHSVLVTDLQVPPRGGLDLIGSVFDRRIPVSIIVLASDAKVADAVEAFQLGVRAFLHGDANTDARLQLEVQRALRDRVLEDQVLDVRRQLQALRIYDGIVTASPRMHSVLELAVRLGRTTTTVLIEGETGTGKEQVARAIHKAGSGTRFGPLVAVNCAALPENLLESELFGHEKGAFTSAVATRKGRFELAEGGTMFLDEVGDVPAAMQAKLLRVLQERKFERVGGTQSIEVDVRVITATNRSLTQLVKAGKFREDLFYRLNVVKIDLPPLRDRPEDIPLLATHFCAKYAVPGQQPKRIGPAAMEVLIDYPWPGNVRELENVVERASVVGRAAVIEPDDLPADLCRSGECPSAPRQDVRVWPLDVTD